MDAENKEQTAMASEQTNAAQVEENVTIQTQNEEPQTDADVKDNKPTLDEIIKSYSALSREELVKELKNLLNNNDFETLRERVPLLRNAFSVLPKETIEQENQEPVKEENNEQATENSEQTNEEENKNLIDVVEKEFYDLYNLYKQKRQQYLQEQEQIKEDNLKKKKVLLDDLKNLLGSELSLKEVHDEFNKIQDKWKEIGNVPHSEVNNLWESYHFLMNKFYEKIKINRELRDLDLKKNLEDKLALCEKAEELLLSEDINMSFQILQEYHRQWKQIGAVPPDKNDEVWERFRKASDDINARRREYYEKRADELESNLKQKQELLDMAIEVNSHERNKSSQWNEDAEKMNALVEKWKTIGPVPRQYNEDIWNKFKAQKDGFFAARKEAFAHSKQEEEENYNKKVAICEKAEAITKRTDYNQATKELLALQEEWKQIGYVKKSLSDKIWLRFRAACDEFFKLKSEDFMRTHQEAEGNIKAKEELIEELSKYEFTDDKVQNVNTLKDFQKRWFEIGFTPKQERIKLQKKWDEIIAQNKEKLQITAEEIAQRGARFLENVAQMAGGAKKAISNRIANLEKQIDSLENNIGFLSSSKNAEILKREFERKINHLKEEKANLLRHLQDKEEDKNTNSSTPQNDANTSENENTTAENAETNEQ